MKLCNFFSGQDVHLAVLNGRGLIDVTAAGFTYDMGGLISAGDEALASLVSLLRAELPVLDESCVRFANICNPKKLVCVGLNYREHAKETGGVPPDEPVLFSKFNDALSPAGAEIPLPSWQRCYDYEAELVIVVGKAAWNVPESEAMRHIFGYSCGNDLSARDCQFISNQWLIGKSFPSFGPAGPFITTADSFDPNAHHSISCRVNGETVQSDFTDGMLFNCATVLSYASKYFPLSPGDLIFTGTPSGVILGRPKGERVWLKAGDFVEVEIEGLGVLKNCLTDM